MRKYVNFTLKSKIQLVYGSLKNSKTLDYWQYFLASSCHSTVRNVVNKIWKTNLRVHRSCKYGKIQHSLEIVCLNFLIGLGISHILASGEQHCCQILCMILMNFITTVFLYLSILYFVFLLIFFSLTLLYNFLAPHRSYVV